MVIIRYNISKCWQECIITIRFLECDKINYDVYMTVMMTLMIC